MNICLRKTGYCLPSIIIIILSLSIYFIQTRINVYKGLESKIEEFIMLPKGEYLRPFVLGYDQFVADIIWLRAIQIIGDNGVTSKGFDWIYHALDVVTTLDPKFSYAYQFGGVTLAVLGKQPEKSNILLEKGFKENPEVWQLPFYIGFNYFFYMQNYKLAAEYMAKASEIQGHPEYLPKLAARLYVQAGNPDVALEFLTRVYKETKDEKIRLTIEQRIKEVIVERDIRILEDAVKKYNELYKVYPVDLTELIKKDLIRNIPDEPFGGSYHLDPATGSIQSSIIKNRMKIYEKGK